MVGNIINKNNKRKRNDERVLQECKERERK